MSDINGKEAERLLVKAWKRFCNDYDEKLRKYSKSKIIGSKTDAENAHWICWNESDLMLQLGTQFYNQLAEETISGIEMHFDKNLTHSNFGNYDFDSKLDVLNKRLGRKRGPKLDLIIVEEESEQSFLLCGEAKCFHYSGDQYPPYFKGVTNERFRKDIDTLLAIRDLGIAEQVVFIMLDDFYWIRNDDIEGLVREACKEANITPLVHNSRAKTEFWK